MARPQHFRCRRFLLLRSRLLFKFCLPEEYLIAGVLSVGRTGHKLQITAHVPDSVVVILEFAVDGGSVEVAFRPHRIDLRPSVVSRGGGFKLLLIDSIFGQQLLLPHRLGERRPGRERAPSGGHLLKLGPDASLLIFVGEANRRQASGGIERASVEPQCVHGVGKGLGGIIVRGLPII